MTTIENDQQWWHVRRFVHTPERLAWVVATEREAAGMSVEDLAEKTGIEPERIRGVESGQPEIGPGAAQALLRTLGVKTLALPSVLAKYAA